VFLLSCIPSHVALCIIKPGVVPASTGDNGAYDSGGLSLSVDDPASQPYVVATGGTRLFLTSGQVDDHESTWDTNNTIRAGASGGGASSVWSLPFWQIRSSKADRSFFWVSKRSIRRVPFVQRGEFFLDITVRLEEEHRDGAH